MAAVAAGRTPCSPRLHAAGIHASFMHSLYTHATTGTHATLGTTASGGASTAQNNRSIPALRNLSPGKRLQTDSHRGITRKWKPTLATRQWRSARYRFDECLCFHKKQKWLWSQKTGGGTPWNAGVCTPLLRPVGRRAGRFQSSLPHSVSPVNRNCGDWSDRCSVFQLR